MTVMIVGGEVFANIGLLIAVHFCIVFYCIFKIVCPCTAFYLFLAFRLQLLNKRVES